MKIIKTLIMKNAEFLKYTFFGIFTTVINIAVYHLFNLILGPELYLISNVISWFFAVVFAFITNKLWVFNSKSMDKSILIKELSGFIGARLFSLIIEEIGLFFMIDLLKMQVINLNLLGININGELIAKTIMQVFVVLINYVFSKIFIFKTNNNK